MSNPQEEVKQLVASFVDELGGIWQRAIASSFGTNGTNGHSNGRAKGDKRSQAELDALAEKFVEFVSKNEGLRIEQIHKQLGTNTKEMALPIRKLIAEKRIKTKGQKRATLYFVGAKS